MLSQHLISVSWFITRGFWISATENVPNMPLASHATWSSIWIRKWLTELENLANSIWKYKWILHYHWTTVKNSVILGIEINLKKKWHTFIEKKSDASAFAEDYTKIVAHTILTSLITLFYFFQVQEEFWWVSSSNQKN